MPRGQTFPQAWLVTDARLGNVRKLVARLPRGTGVLVRQHELARGERVRLLRGLRLVGRVRGLRIVDEAERGSARVHDAREIRLARLGGARLMLLSPLFATRTHPGAVPLPRMRAAALARLAGRPLLALGGMDARRFRLVRGLGFDGWAGVDAWGGSRAGVTGAAP